MNFKNADVEQFQLFRLYGTTYHFTENAKIKTYKHHSIKTHIHMKQQFPIVKTINNIMKVN